MIKLISRSEISVTRLILRLNRYDWTVHETRKEKQSGSIVKPSLLFDCQPEAKNKCGEADNQNDQVIGERTSVSPCFERN